MHTYFDGVLFVDAGDWTHKMRAIETGFRIVAGSSVVLVQNVGIAEADVVRLVLQGYEKVNNQNLMNSY